MNKYTRKPSSSPSEIKNIFERFNLKENPFPYNPFIEPESDDPKRNGQIFDKSIRSKEFEKFEKQFLQAPIKGDHNRLGYLLESSFTGRGNGKSAFLVNIQNAVNTDFGDATSKGINKTFAVYFKAKSGGQNTKFWQISEEIIISIANRKLFEEALISLRFNVLTENGYISKIQNDLQTEEDYKKLLDNGWLLQKDVNFTEFHLKLKQKLINAGISSDLAGLLSNKSSDASNLIMTEYCVGKPESWKKKELNKLLFDDIAKFFALSEFNGCYILLDEFEKIADFQKPTERIEFAYELRQSILESNMYSGVTGFFIFIITMHPGTQRLILEAWEKSGINARTPLPGEDFIEIPHVILFEDIGKSHISALLRVYLDYFRIDSEDTSKKELYPFDEDAVNLIAEISKFNAARILKLSHLLLADLAQSGKDRIDKNFVLELIAKNKKFPQEDINSFDFLNRDINPLENALSKAKLKE